MFTRLGIFFIFIFSQMGFSSEYSQHLVKESSSVVIEDMRKKIGNLGEDKNFTFIDLGISEEDLHLINQFKIETSDQYARFGSLHLLKDELPNFLRSIGSNNEELIQKITEIIFQIAYNVKEASNKETAWVCVRASIPNHDFDIPRWHSDGYYYAPYSGFAFKFATILKGNSTLFHQLSKDIRDVFDLHFDDREFLSNLIDVNTVESAKLGQGAFFIVGDRNRAAAHSEPKIDGERLFISVLPGNDDEINELYARWHP